MKIELKSCEFMTVILKSGKEDNDGHNNLDLIDSSACDGDDDGFHRGGSAPRCCEELEVPEADQ